jgi:hypothetical protein
MGKAKVHTEFGGKFLRKQPLGRPRRLENNIMMDIMEISYDIGK